MSAPFFEVGLGDRSYPILIGSLPSHAEIEAQFGKKAAWLSRRPFVVTDRHVADAGYIRALEPLLGTAIPQTSFTVLPPGENFKTLASIESICRDALADHVDRNSLFVALGGGVVGDMAGLAAGLYMRGVDFIQVPTTLLAMVDSSVGGKTAVDLPEGKNLVGMFHQPRAVFIDPVFLETLPDREIRCGLAEIIKTAVLFDRAMFEEIAVHAKALSARDFSLLPAIIEKTCRLRAAVVAADEREHGCRALLNYGHTFGHAIETLSEFRLNHGEAVAIGMNVAAKLSVRLGKMSAAAEMRQRLLLESIGLPVVIPNEISPEAIFRTMLMDKKTTDGVLRLVLPREIGKGEIVSDVRADVILALLTECYA